MNPAARNRKRKWLFDQQRGICALCGRPMTASNVSIDHIRPQSAGGRHNIDNLQAVHVACNKARGTAPCPAEIARAFS